MFVRIRQRVATSKTSRIAALILPHLVAAYFIYHAASIIIGSIPAPYAAMNRSAWKNPSVQSELEVWASNLQRVGWDVTPDELEDTCWNACHVLMRGYRVAITPFRDYQRYTGTTQAWSMFVAPHRHPSVLHIDIQRRGKEWQPVYRPRSEEARWRETQLNHIRFRSAIFRFSWPQYQTSWSHFGEWAAEQAVNDFPNAEHLRVRFYTYQTLSPEQVRAGETAKGTFNHSQTFALDGLR